MNIDNLKAYNEATRARHVADGTQKLLSEKARALLAKEAANPAATYGSLLALALASCVAEGTETERNTASFMMAAFMARAD